MEYARETLSLGLLFLEFKDAVKEGDGTRVLRCWKYFLLLFHASGHTNYCLEAHISQHEQPVGNELSGVWLKNENYPSTNCLV